MQWISVDERLPETFEWVIVAIRCFGHPRLTVPKIPYYVGGGGDWYRRESNRSVREEEVEVTHWMPLPEPPETTPELFGIKVRVDPDMPPGTAKMKSANGDVVTITGIGE